MHNQNIWWPRVSRIIQFQVFPVKTIVVVLFGDTSPNIQSKIILNSVGGKLAWGKFIRLDQILTWDNKSCDVWFQTCWISLYRLVCFGFRVLWISEFGVTQILLLSYLSELLFRYHLMDFMVWKIFLFSNHYLFSLFTIRWKQVFIPTYHDHNNCIQLYGLTWVISKMRPEIFLCYYVACNSGNSKLTVTFVDMSSATHPRNNTFRPVWWFNVSFGRFSTSKFKMKQKNNHTTKILYSFKLQVRRIYFSKWRLFRRKHSFNLNRMMRKTRWQSAERETASTSWRIFFKDVCCFWRAIVDSRLEKTSIEKATRNQIRWSWGKRYVTKPVNYFSRKNAPYKTF